MIPNPLSFYGTFSSDMSFCTQQTHTETCATTNENVLKSSQKCVWLSLSSCSITRVCGSSADSRCSGHELFAVFVMISAYRDSWSVCLERLETSSECVSSSYFQQTLIVLATLFKYLPCASHKGAGVGIKSFIREEALQKSSLTHTSALLFLWWDDQTIASRNVSAVHECWKSSVQCQASNWVNIWFQWFSISNFLSLHIMNYY